ncbi:MAG: metal-dependent transcriptional regulator [Eubacterium sp.]|nr:metal-dependent transcriptional regulator [Eubacterium sp.]
MQESGEMYLETILVLSKKNNSVRALDVAEHLGYSKPSVSRAVGILKKNGYIESYADNSLHLTDSGRQIAEKIYERHTVLTEVLKMLGVKEETAVKDACKIEHDISDESFEAIKDHIKNRGSRS